MSKSIDVCDVLGQTDQSQIVLTSLLNSSCQRASGDWGQCCCRPQRFSCLLALLWTVCVLLSASKTQTVSQGDCFVPHWAVEMGFLHWWSFFWHLGPDKVFFCLQTHFIFFPHKPPPSKASPANRFLTELSAQTKKHDEKRENKRAGKNFGQKN